MLELLIFWFSILAVSSFGAGIALLRAPGRASKASVVAAATIVWAITAASIGWIIHLAGCGGG